MGPWGSGTLLPLSEGRAQSRVINRVPRDRSTFRVMCRSHRGERRASMKRPGISTATSFPGRPFPLYSDGPSGPVVRSPGDPWDVQVVADLAPRAAEAVPLLGVLVLDVEPRGPRRSGVGLVRERLARGEPTVLAGRRIRRVAPQPRVDDRVRPVHHAALRTVCQIGPIDDGRIAPVAVERHLQRTVVRVEPDGDVLPVALVLLWEEVEREVVVRVEEPVHDVSAGARSCS